MRYIDIVRSVVRNAKAHDISALTWDEQKHHINAIRQKIDDIEIVVRCKDCVYCEPYAIDTGEDCMTGLWCGENQKDITSQDYCSYGERKGGDTE